MVREEHKAPKRTKKPWLLAAVLLGLGVFYAGPASAATYTAADSATFASLLTSTVLGDTIVLNAGTTYTPTGNGFVLPDKGAGTAFITIRSSAIGSLPASGTRVSTSHAVNMPKIRAKNGSAGDTSQVAIKTSGPAHHFKFIGCEFISTADNLPATVLLELGRNDNTQTSLSQVPHNLVFDRCIARANSGTQRLRRAFAVSTGYIEIIDSRVYDCKDQGPGDSQAIAITNGPGPFVITNCYLEAASETILTGGSPVKIPNLIVQNLTVTRCHISKPLAWQTQNWNVKNLFELKAGKYISLDGNRLENSWHQAGDFKGTAISIKRIAQPDQGNTWTETDNVHINNNIVSNCGIGLAMGGSTEDHWGPGGVGDIVWTSIGWPKNVSAYNNLFDKLNGPETWTGNQCYFITHTSGDVNTVVDHNSVFGNFQTGNGSRIMDVGTSASGPYNGYVFTNNIVSKGAYGFKSPNGDDENCFNFYFPSAVYKKNVTKALTSSVMLPTYHGDWNPTSLAFPVDYTPVLVNAGNPGSNYAGYKVIAGSAYDNAGTDGKDVGCDIDIVNNSTAGCVSGSWQGAVADSIEYTGSLGAQNGGYGFGTNGWVTVSGFTSPAITTGSLTYTSSPRSIITKGNKIQPAVNSRAYRNFPGTITTSGKTLWVSFRAKQTGGSFPTNHAGFQLCDATNGTGSNYIFLGKPGFSATNWGWDHAGTVLTVSGTPNMDPFLLYKLQFTGTNVTISMWMNPVLTERQLPAPNITQTYAHTANIASMWAGVGGNSTNYQFDEFRMSPVFTDVTK